MTRQEVKVGDTGLHHTCSGWEECVVMAVTPTKVDWSYVRRGVPHVEIEVVRKQWRGEKETLALICEINRRDLLVGEEAQARRVAIQEEAQAAEAAREVERGQIAHYHICRILNPKAATPEEVDWATSYFISNCNESPGGRAGRLQGLASIEGRMRR